MESRLYALILEHGNFYKARVSSVFIKVDAQQGTYFTQPEREFEKDIHKSGAQRSASGPSRNTNARKRK
jgi:hypothetical protein